MQKTIVAISFACVFLISACSPNDEQNAQNDQNAQNNTDMIHFESNKEQANRLENNNDQPEYGSPEDKKRFNSGNENEQYTDLFTTPESKRISDKLLRYPDVKQAQVAVKEDEIVVGIMLSTGYNNNIRHTVKSDVESMKPEKKVTVYTDARYLNNMDDMNAKRNPSDVDEFIAEYLENFFHK